ncbi:YjbE family putative metal transport protein [Terrilactibacillus sp. BCM23-1]|uniref:YjbE family putative metal transport protein n=1 Tax=Terrilactibacillus tamarindi TaxID=2599694 RepID=A0A6N8CRA4_9BACI|nr:TerC family protein [Terrilactibacillus tamarindi]MTT30496.1 YjbE family putative metal transport protein [Terrilactibacillus tamarindi]
MDILSLTFLTSLLLIIGIDLILAGDNAIVIALAARKLPKDQQKKAIIYGTVGAVLIRAVATLVVVWLLKVPGLHLIGGILLVWIAYKLLVDHNDHKEVKEANSLSGAIRTIIIADALMGLDNVLAVAGASHGSYLLIILGLLISVPLIMWGSTLFLKLVDKYPWITYVGSAVLALTAGKMIMAEPFLVNVFEDLQIIKWILIGLLIVGVILIGLRKNAKQMSHASE